MNKKNIKKMSSLLQNNNTNSDKYQLINITSIVLDEDQPRKLFDEESIKELSQSIKQFGVLTPVSVSKQEDGTFILRHGERRYRASKIAGLDKIPAIIDNEYSNNKLIKQLIENIQRENLSMDEIADAISTLHNQEKMSLSEIAQALGKSNAYVSNFYNYSILEQTLKDKLITKTNDILVISEFNRILKKIIRTSDNILKKLLENSYYEFIDKAVSLNRNSITTLKTLLENLENSFNERQELRREEFLDQNDSYNENYENQFESDYTKDDDTTQENINQVDTYDYDIHSDFNTKQENINNKYTSDEPRIEIANNIIFYCSKNRKFPLIKIVDNLIDDSVQDEIVAVIKEKLQI